MEGVAPVANEAALRYLTEELAKAQLQAAQAIGNLALAHQMIQELKESHENASNGEQGTDS